MVAAATIRNQIESSLSSRVPQALSPRERTEPARIPCGIPPLDEILGGGLPVGSITEWIGSESSGRTTAAFACLASITAAAQVCAWIDTSDALDPESAAANGIDLDRLLWIRCGVGDPSTPHLSTPAASIVNTPSPSQTRHTGGGSPHPRSEGRDMPQAISAMFHAHGGLYDHQLRREKRSIGTPGAPNRPLTQRSEDREEQVNSDRLPPRRGENLIFSPRRADPHSRRETSSNTHQPSTRSPALHKPSSPWKALDQALRATDLLLQGGGFGAIVLDLGSVSPEHASRIPMATWFRFRAACERTRVSLILLTQHPCARSSAEAVVHLQSGSMESQNKVMSGIRYRAEAKRTRSREATARVIPIRKPPQSVRDGVWRSVAPWAHIR